MFMDDVTRIVVIWSSNAVFWEATAQTLVIYLGLNQNMMLLCGYVGVALMMTVVRDIAENAVARSSNEMGKVVIEVAYVGMSAVAGIMVWQGNRAVAYERGISLRGWGSSFPFPPFSFPFTLSLPCSLSPLVPPIGSGRMTSNAFRLILR